MDQQEYEYWKSVTASSEHGWRFDHILHLNHNTYLWYKGGIEEGSYIMVSDDGHAEIGNYKMALPCITDAEFTTVHRNMVADTNDKAVAIVLEKMGLAFLINWLFDEPVYAS